MTYELRPTRTHELPVFELVLPARFAEFMEGCDLFQTMRADADHDGAEILPVWKAATFRRGQTVLKIDFDNGGRAVLNFFEEYAGILADDGWTADGRDEFTRGERRGGKIALDRIQAIWRQVRAADPSRSNLEEIIMASTTIRPLSVIAEEIAEDWKKVNFGAVPYLDAMSTLTSIDDSYGLDSGRSIVSYFLSNASTWRGETAKRVKAELRAMKDG